MWNDRFEREAQIVARVLGRFNGVSQNAIVSTRDPVGGALLIFAHCSWRADARRRPLYERAYVRSHRAADNWLRVFRSITMFIRAPRSYHYFIISKKVIVRAAWRGSR